MDNKYVITPHELALKGLNLSDYVFDETFVSPIILLGVDICVSRICFLNDAFQFESDIEKALEEKPELIQPFKKLQYRVIYNLVFQNEESPTDQYVDTIISQELRWGKINGFQKGLFYRYN